MNCFNHQKAEAVGVCKFCMKGLCPDCAKEIESSLSCKGSCEQKVKLLNNAPSQQDNASLIAKLLPLITVLYGSYLIFTFSGLFGYQRESGLLLMGVVMVAFGLAMFFKNKRSKNA